MGVPGNQLTNNFLNKKYFNIAVLVLLLAGSFVLESCTDVPSGVNTNSAPETYLSLFPDSIISPHITRIKITWWGDDPDGLIQGYRFSFDSTNWTYSEGNDSTFQLVIVGNDSTFRFWVAAVDDKGNIDPTPASNLFPVYNSPPAVTFNAGTSIPDTSFPVATFAWTGTDPDGNSSISKYYYALNDTSNWNELAASVSSITLRQNNGIVPGQNNKLYMKVKDIAGIYSPVVTMPDSGRTWYVRPVIGKILLIDDYPASLVDNSSAEAFYRSILDTLPFAHSELDIKVNGGSNIPKIKNPMFVETLKLFECVIWYGNRGSANEQNPNYQLATETLPFYLAAGGKLFFSAGFPNSIDAGFNPVEFAPVDSVTFYQVTGATQQTPTIVIDNNYPELTIGPTNSPDRIRGIIQKPSAKVIYKMPFNPTYDTTQITVCIKDAAVNPKVFLLSVALNRLNGNGNAVFFLRRILGTDFNIHN